MSFEEEIKKWIFLYLGDEIMGIKVFKKDNKISAKGIPNVSSLGILAGILILFLCFLSQSSPRPINVLVIAIFGMIIIIASIIHAIRETKET